MLLSLTSNKKIPCHKGLDKRTIPWGSRCVRCPTTTDSESVLSQHDAALPHPMTALLIFPPLKNRSRDASPQLMGETNAHTECPVSTLFVHQTFVSPAL